MKQTTQYRSSNKYDINLWVLKVINSCITKPQLSSANKLKNIFFELYGDEELYYLHDYSANLIRNKIRYQPQQNK